MAQIARECPHCRAEKIGFAYRGHAEYRPGSQQALIFMQCEGCSGGIIVHVGSPQGAVAFWAHGSYADPGKILNVYPETAALRCPADVPGSVQAAFLSGLDNLGRRGGTNAAAIMFRRAVEIAVKTISPTAPKDDNLRKRIDDLSPDFATPAMKKWAHKVQLDANEAAHEPEEFTDEDAKELHIFAEMFLTYAFTLPAMLKRATSTGTAAGKSTVKAVAKVP